MRRKTQPDSILWQQRVIPLLKQLEQYLKTEALHFLPKSATGNAIKFTLELWPNLKRYTEEGKQTTI